MKKSFKFQVKSKTGKLIYEEIVTFGSKEKPFPENYKDNPYVQYQVMEYKQEVINRSIEVKITEINI